MIKLNHLLYELIYKYFAFTRYRVLTRQLGLKQSYADIGGQKIYFFESQNTGQPLVLIHGLLDAAFGFRKIIPYLDSKFKLYVIDIPGFGKSKLPPIQYLYQVDIFSNMIYLLFQKLELDNIVLCGHSMGGLISQHIALKDKLFRRVQKLILLSSGGVPHPERDKMRAVLFPADHEEVGRLLQHLYHKETPMPSKLIRKTLVHAWNSREYKFLAENTIAREFEIFFGSEAKKIKIPTWIISGKQDLITTPEAMQTLKSYIRGSKLLLLDHARHAIHLEKPKEVAELINSVVTTQHIKDVHSE